MGQLDLGLETSDRRRLFEEVCLKRTLERAFKKVKANRGAPGPDGETLEEFEQDLESGLDLDLDLERFFDTVNKDRVIHLLRSKVEDRRVIRLVAMTLRSGIWIDGKVEKSRVGLPQGSPLSPLLSNIVLHELDEELERRGLHFVRDADDCNVFVSSRKAAERVLEKLTRFIEGKLKLKVNRTKSQTGLSSTVKFGPKYLVRKLVKRGIRREVAYREVYLRNHGRWRLAHTFGVGRAWSEHWFRHQGVVTVSRETRSHWKSLQAYPRLS